MSQYESTRKRSGARGLGLAAAMAIGVAGIGLPMGLHAAPAKNAGPSHAGANPTYSSAYLNSSVVKVKTSTKKNLYLDLACNEGREIDSRPSFILRLWAARALCDFLRDP
jgi:hypothetical protein